MKTSAGILVYRRRQGELQVLLGHMGGPFWSRKDAGAWTIPKGEIQADEDGLEAARREFKEETGYTLNGPFLKMDPVNQRNKIIVTWAIELDLDPGKIKSNTFDLEWPPQSGTIQSFPEIDKADWFEIEVAKVKVVKGQRAILEQLIEIANSQ